MAARRRTLAGLAAGALLVPLGVAAPTAFADHIDPRGIELACPAGSVPTGQFNDVDEDTLFEEYIHCVAAYDVARGRADGDFDPVDNVSRAQMAQFVFRVGLRAGFEFDTTTDPGYTDDDALSEDARDAVWGLTNAGVVRGTTLTTFSPGGSVSRAQMATFIAGAVDAFGVTDFGATTTDFFDDDDGTTHESNINRIAQEGITTGQGGDRVYGPSNPTVRGQMAAFLARSLDVLVEAGAINPAPAPTAAAAAVTNADGEQTANDVVVTWTAGEGTESGTTFAVTRFSVTPADGACPAAATDDNIIDDDGIAVVDETDTDQTATDVDVPPGCYAYLVSATPPNGGLATVGELTAVVEVEADVTPPDLTAAVPVDIDDGLGSTETVRLTFSEPVTVSNDTAFSLQAEIVTFDIVSVVADGNVVTLTLSDELPDAPNPNNNGYTVVLGAGAVSDAAGNANAAEEFLFQY